MTRSEPFDRLRYQFPTLERCTYLLSHSLGPAPNEAMLSMQSYVQAWQAHAEEAWTHSWWEMAGVVGDAVSRVIGADPGTVQVQASATAAMAVVASCFDFSTSKNKVVTSGLDFPSMGYFWQAQQRRGARVEVVGSADQVRIPDERILEAIDDSTVIVALAHVSYRSSARVDVEAIVRRAHEVGAVVVLDIYQSAGALQLGVRDWNVDFCVGGSIKWLCGGPACGYLYVRPDLIGRYRPLSTGWIAHAAPFEFRHGEVDYDDSVRRFAQGTPNVSALHSFLPGLKVIEQVGMARIEEESIRRTGRIIEYARAEGWQLHTPEPAGQRGGTVMIRAARPPEVAQQLAKRRILVDARPEVGIRVSPHFFNTDEELESTLEILKGILGG